MLSQSRPATSPIRRPEDSGLEPLTCGDALGAPVEFMKQAEAGDPVWTGPSENDGLSIEVIIDRTWKPKESAPESATPTGQWTASIWGSHLRSCDDLLSDLPAVLESLPPAEVIYPPFLCGPLNAIQRIEFLRFHLDRHLSQIQLLKSVVLV